MKVCLLFFFFLGGGGGGGDYSVMPGNMVRSPSSGAYVDVLYMKSMYSGV